MAERMLHYDAMEGKNARGWHSRFGEPVMAPRNTPMVDFNQGTHAEALRPVTNMGEVVYDAKQEGVLNPNKIDHFVDPYTDLTEMAPEPLRKA